MNNIIKDENFKFLENYDICEYNKISNYINDIYDYIKQEKYEVIFNTIRKIIESYIYQISKVLDLKLDIESKSNLFEIFKIIEGTNKVKRQIIDNLHQLRNICNRCLHFNDVNTPNFSIIHYLFLLDQVLYYFKDNKFELLDSRKFDQNIYINLNKNLSISCVNLIQNNFNDSFIIEEVSIKDIFCNLKGNIIIPLYQRQYTWDEEQIKMLIEDIKNNYENFNQGYINHYMGTIACKLVLENDKKMVKIIDGQQRITTSLLLICAIRDILCRRQDKLSQEYEWMYNKKIQDFLTNPFISNNDKTSFKDLIKYDENFILSDKIDYIKSLNSKKTTNNFYKNYYSFYSEFSNYDNEKLKEIIYLYLNNFNFTLISFNSIIFNNQKEMDIFDTINSRGMRLDLSDLTKNYILSLCEIDILNNCEEKIIDLYNSIFPKNQKSKFKNDFFNILSSFFNKEEIKNSYSLQFEKAKKAILDICIFLSIKDKNITLQEYDTLICTLKEYYELYMFCYDPSDDEVPSFLKEGKLDLSTIFKLIKFKQWKKYFIYPLILFKNIIKDPSQLTSQTKKWIKEIFLFIIKWLIVKQINVGLGDSTLKKDISKFFRDLFNKDKKYLNNYDEEIKLIFDKLKTNDMFKFTQKEYENFENKLKSNIDNNDIKSSILLFMEYNFEECSKKDRMPSTFLYNDKLSLEHIMPQDKKEWDNFFNINNNGMNKEEIDKEYYQTVNQLGNSLVIPIRMNSKIKNKTFEEKKLVFQEIKSSLYTGIKDISVDDKQEWTFTIIRQRTEALAKKLLNMIKNN